ncbi:MAG: DUF1800 domain-containing protein [Phenylobacterium sp.]|uniref:DUF1800 domain-containing protein n=1 Tax=Phenylobacterium sp. TaxID=1871053 RepID=UPI001795D40B|nr:DUF1800 domain-containing protein [Phenylobacterium sp.]MBA4792410.1 DUF1800 domain-containing protein [Phenylobacterium sp.]
MALPDRDLQAAIAATRFGLGARPGEIAAARSDPQGFLADQISTSASDRPQTFALPERRLEAIRAFGAARKDALEASRARANEAEELRLITNERRRKLQDDVTNDVLVRTANAANTPQAFAERWVLFWSNHFTVGQGNIISAATIGPYEDLALRPYVFGAFRDLLLSAETHPAMLIYLNQDRSVGPNSLFAQRRAKAPNGRLPGLNENLAREILELHTVGVNGGYSQADVTEFARALTGISFERLTASESAGQPRFRPAAHEPGEREVMGVRYAQSGENQAVAILSDLASKPQTARFVSWRIARHFVADDPPEALVRRLERTWMDTDGALDQVARALVGAPEAWDPTPRKFKTPYEFMVSSWRAAGAAPRDIKQLALLTAMGQKPFSAPSPEGWPEEEAAWATPDGMIKRLVWTEAFAPRAVGDRDPSLLALEALGARLSGSTATAIRRAESRGEAFALLLMSPEFQRR